MGVTCLGHMNCAILPAIVTVLVLGSTGMLGSRVVEMFKQYEFNVYSTSRNGSNSRDLAFEARRQGVDECVSKAGIRPDYIVNAIGVIKPRINEKSAESVMNAVGVNAMFPGELAEYASKTGAKVIQIATDCVYSGTRGSYVESDAHDPLDVYGKTKSLGEVPSPVVMHIRASIIGPEQGRATSLWEWVRKQPPRAEVNGYLNHHWNGVTTDAFADVCAGVIKNNRFVSGVIHLVPQDVVTKFELVRLIADRSGRHDLAVLPTSPGSAVNRTLSTENDEINRALWSDSSYGSRPSIAKMIERAVV